MTSELAVQFTYLDIIVIAIISIFAVFNAKKGTAGALLRFLPTLLGILLSWRISGEVIKYVRGTFVFSLVMSKISAGLNLGGIVPDMTLSAQNSLISSMNIPDFIREALLNNNNSVVYSLFDAQSLKDYIAGFLTNIFISIAVALILYFVGIIIGRVVLKIFSILDDVPVIGLFSKIGGFIIGTIKGVCIVWIIGIAITFFCCKPSAQEFMVLLESSFIAGWLYKNNILLYVVLQVFA